MLEVGSRKPQVVGAIAVRLVPQAVPVLMGMPLGGKIIPPLPPPPEHPVPRVNCPNALLPRQPALMGTGAPLTPSGSGFIQVCAVAAPTNASESRKVFIG